MTRRPGPVAPRGDLWLPARTAAVLEELESTLLADPDEVRPHLFVIGPRGTGKTSIITESARRLRAHGQDVTVGSEPSIGTEPSIGAGPDAAGSGARFRLLDDAGRHDPDLIDQLTTDVDHGWTLVLALAAGVDPHELAGTAENLGPHRWLELTPWSVAEVEEYLESSYRDRTDRPLSALRLHTATGGFPWLVAPLAAGRHDEAETAIRARLHALSPAAQELLEELAVGLDVDASGRARDSASAFDALLSELESSSLMTSLGTIPPAIASITTVDLTLHRRRRLQRRTLELMRSQAVPDAELLRRLAATGLKTPDLAAALLRTGDGSLDRGPADAGTWYDLAEGAGADPEPLAIRRAEIALLHDDLDRAVQCADDALSRGEPSEPDRTARAATTAFMRAGFGPRAAELCRWLGPRLDRRQTNVAAMVLISQGDRATAEQLLEARPVSRSPTLDDGATSLLADAMRRSLGDDPMDAVPDAARAAAMWAAEHHDEFLPEHPAAIAAVIALQTGDLATAESVLLPVVGALRPGTHQQRSLAMLTAWTRMLGGDLSSARLWRTTAAAGAQPRTSREIFWDAALGLGIARRSDDARAMATEWSEAPESMLAHPVDLFDLLPLGELHIAGVRVRTGSRFAPHLRAAWSLLETLGHPPLWTTALHWSAIQGGILESRPRDITPHAAGLVESAPKLPLAATLAAAGRVWISVLGGKVDVDSVVRTAHHLRDAGLSWDGQRLAGHAAARAKDRHDSGHLLECARTLGATRSTAHAPTGVRFTVHLPTGTTHLSRRERDVGELVTAGHTYKQIGTALFLSERTVEHHVARIRVRFGAGDRSQLLEYLRAALAQLPPEG